ncbi:MAG: hypothetical protein MHPSP_002570 [Paramarteilia canceri]
MQVKSSEIIRAILANENILNTPVQRLSESVLGKISNKISLVAQKNHQRLNYYKSGFDGCSFFPIYQSKILEINMFKMVPGFYFPAHNHPGMNVLMKMIHGQGNVTSFNPINKAQRKIIFSASTRLIQSCNENCEGCEKCSHLINPSMDNIHIVGNDKNSEKNAIFGDYITPGYDENDHKILYYTALSLDGESFYKLEPVKF